MHRQLPLDFHVNSLAKVNDLFYAPSADGYKMLHTSDMGAFAPRCIPISPPVLLDDGRLQSQLLNKEIPSVEGLSGGFVVKLFPGKPIPQFEFVGIQSEQSTLNGRVTSIHYSQSDVVLDCLDHFASTLNEIEADDLSGDAI